MADVTPACILLSGAAFLLGILAANTPAIAFAAALIVVYTVLRVARTRFRR